MRIERHVPGHVEDTDSGPRRLRRIAKDGFVPRRQELGIGRVARLE